MPQHDGARAGCQAGRCRFKATVKGRNKTTKAKGNTAGRKPAEIIVIAEVFLLVPALSSARHIAWRVSRRMIIISARPRLPSRKARSMIVAMGLLRRHRSLRMALVAQRPVRTESSPAENKASTP